MGRLGDLYGRRRLYVAGFALFTVSTSIAAVSNSLEMLLAARIVQGVASSMVVANAVAIVTSSFPASRRGQALGMLLGAVGTGLAMGPVFGGVMIEALDWRAIFWTRIPLGAIEAVLVWKFLRDPPAEQRPKGLDLTGSMLLFGIALQPHPGHQPGRFVGLDQPRRTGAVLDQRRIARDLPRVWSGAHPVPCWRWISSAAGGSARRSPPRCCNSPGWRPCWCCCRSS